GRPKWCAMAAEYSPGLMPTNSTARPGARMSGMVLPAASASCLFVGRNGSSMSLLAGYVVGEQQVAVAQIKHAVGDDGLGGGVDLRPLRLAQSAHLLVLLLVHFSQGHHALPVADVEAPARRDNRAAAHAAVLPVNLAGLPVEADQPRLPGAVERLADADGPS